MSAESSLGQEVHLAAGPQKPTAHLHPSIKHDYDEPVGALLNGDDDIAGEDLPEDVKALIKRCMDGTEPKELAVRVQDPKTLSPRHINMCLLRAAGFKAGEIAGVMGLGLPAVANVLRCEYGKKVIRAVMYARGVRVLDIRTKLDEYASDILDQMYDLTVQSQDLETVSRVGFGLLDRAGYAAAGKGSSAVNVNVNVPGGEASKESSFSRLANALDLSKSVDVSVMPKHTPSRPPDEVVQSPSADGAASHQSDPPCVGSSDPSGGGKGPAATEPTGFGSVRLTKVGS